MRRGEALGLHWADVRLDEGWLSLRYSLGEHRRADGSRSLELGTVKGGVAHAIALDSSTVEVLRSHQAAQRRDRLALGERWRDEDLVFARGRLWLRADQHGGAPLNPDRVSEAFRRDAARLGRIRSASLTSRRNGISPVPSRLACRHCSPTTSRSGTLSAKTS